MHLDQSDLNVRSSKRIKLTADGLYFSLSASQLAAANDFTRLYKTTFTALTSPTVFKANLQKLYFTVGAVEYLSLSLLQCTSLLTVVFVKCRTLFLLLAHAPKRKVWGLKRPLFIVQAALAKKNLFLTACLAK